MSKIASFRVKTSSCQKSSLKSQALNKKVARLLNISLKSSLNHLLGEWKKYIHKTRINFVW